MPNTYALGYDCVDEFLADVHTGGMGNMDFDYNHATRLLVGAVIVSEIRAAVYEETGNIQYHYHLPNIPLTHNLNIQFILAHNIFHVIQFQSLSVAALGLLHYNFTTI